ncbi:MAG: RsbRD N-terminal domain-containing protein [Calditrichaeota bacterium]|jgi:hypothetical protein|nr:RsbRD N-terminal domain-containing protein [Calditrichota bacterium]MBT7615976.1 RsbRD N-terminal domain-containing protein [Calditrichota bacterium]MBT7788706.1 RsbRD N-terminal domain-containing protein [Calditrichota bacterium]
MKLIEKLRAEKAGIIEDWQKLIFNSYLEDGSIFFKSQQNKFQNPVGHTISNRLVTIFERLLESSDMDLIRTDLDDIIHIRSVQDFSPSEAIGFTLGLKGIIRSRLSSFLKNKSEFDELTAFENRIDHLSLLAFDLYVGCREKIYEIKANEVKRKYFKLLDRSGFIDPERADGK